MLWMHLLGPPPPSVVTASGLVTASNYFDSNGVFRYGQLAHIPLRDFIDKNYSLRGASQLTEFLLPMLSFNPTERPSPRELLKHSWLVI